jgi:hypothetical protein
MTKLYVHLPQVEQLMKEFENVGIETFVDTYTSYESLTGPSDSMKFIEDKVKEYKQIKK